MSDNWTYAEMESNRNYWRDRALVAERSAPAPEADLPTCLRCGQPLSADDMALRCPNNPEASPGWHEVLDPPPWKFGDPVRQGSSLHAAHCERSNPSVYAHYEVCTCHCTPLVAVGGANHV